MRAALKNGYCIPATFSIPGWKPGIPWLLRCERRQGLVAAEDFVAAKSGKLNWISWT